MIRELDIRSVNPGERNQKFLITREIAATFRGSRIVYATSEQNQKVVIKIPAILGGAEKEWTGLKKARESGISVPRPIMLGLTDTGSACIILESVNGEPLFLGNDHEDRIILGQIVKQMHSGVSIPDYGWKQNIKADYSYYDKQLKLWGDYQSQIGIDRSLTQYLFGLLAQPMDSYCHSSPPVFNHNDIHDGQAFKSTKRGITLIDFEDWTEDRPLNDLGMYLFHCLRTSRDFNFFKGFVSGYLNGDTLNENDRLALIFNLLFISTRAVIKYLTYQTDYLGVARQNHQKVLDFIRNETLWKSL